MVRTSDCLCQSRNSLGSIPACSDLVDLRGGDEAVLKTVKLKILCQNVATRENSGCKEGRPTRPDSADTDSLQMHGGILFLKGNPILLRNNLARQYITVTPPYQ